MYCPQCGTEAKENARFCAKCGRDIFDSSEQSRPAHETREAGPYAPNHPSEDRPHVSNHLVWAILVTICWCPPTGIVSIVYAAQVNGRIAAGDFAGARESSQKAKTWAWVSFGLGIPILIFLLVPLFAMLQWFGVVLIVALFAAASAVAYAVDRWLVK